METRVTALLLQPLLLVVVLLLASGATAATCTTGCDWRVLALGDSLTRGAVPSSASEHPYSVRLQQLLQAKYAGVARVQVTAAGLDFMGTLQSARADGGRRELGVTLLPFAQQQLAAARAAGGLRWVVVMAGINDLGNANRTAAEIMPRLKQAYAAAITAGAHVLAIPPFANRFVGRASDNERQRQLLQGRMRDFVAAQPAPQCGRPRVHLALLPEAQFGFWTMPEARRRQLQDDKLHLTPAGYDALGGAVFAAISKQQDAMQAACGGCLCGRGPQQ